MAGTVLGSASPTHTIYLRNAVGVASPRSMPPLKGSALPTHPTRGMLVVLLAYCCFSQISASSHRLSSAHTYHTRVMQVVWLAYCCITQVSASSQRLSFTKKVPYTRGMLVVLCPTAGLSRSMPLLTGLALPTGTRYLNQHLSHIELFFFNFKIT